MDSWRIKVQNFDRSQVPAIAERKAAAMVIKAPKGPNTPVRFAKGETDYIRDVFGDPSAAYPQIWEALEYNQYGPIWLSSPYRVAEGLEDRLPGVMVNTTSVNAFSGGAGPIPADVADETYVVSGATQLFAVLAKSPYAGGDLAVNVTHFMNPLALTEHLFAIKVYKLNSAAAWVQVESYTELSFDEDAKNAAGTRIYMPDRIARSKYIQVVLKDITTWPSITLEATTAVTLAGGTRTDIDLLGHIDGETIPEVVAIPIDFGDDSTFSADLQTAGEVTTLIAASSTATLTAGLVYKILPLAIDDTDSTTFQATRLLSAAAATAAAGHVYAVTPAAPVDIDDDATFTKYELPSQDALALTLAQLQATEADGSKYYKIKRASGATPITWSDDATYTPTRMKLPAAMAAAIADCTEADEGIFQVIPITAMDLTDDATFSWVLDAASLTDDQTQYGTTGDVYYYSVIPAAIDFSDDATFQTPVKLNTVAALTAAVMDPAIGAGTGIYQVTQTEPGHAASTTPETPAYDRAAKLALINLCWDEYKKKTQYPADLFLDDSGFIEVASKFNTLRGNPDGTGGYQKYSYYLHKIAHADGADFSALEATCEGYATAIDNLGLAYFVNDALIYDAYVGKEYWSSCIGRIGVKYAAMEDIYDGLAPAGIDENGHGGLLSAIGSGPHIKKLRHYYDDDEDEALDTMCVNPILWDPGVGAYIGGQKTAQNPLKWTDYSYVNFARATDYIRRNIVQRQLVNQLWKLMDANHRFMVISGCEAIIKPVLAAGILDDAIAFVTATTETNSQRKFVLNVAVRTTPTAEYIEFNFTNVGQGVDVKSVQS